MKKKAHNHHVVYEQHVKDKGGSPKDPRNALALCLDCHFAHHKALPRIPTECLRDENIEFAFELLGLAAPYYFERYYTGTDERIECGLQALLDMEEENEWPH